MKVIVDISQLLHSSFKGQYEKVINQDKGSLQDLGELCKEMILNVIFYKMSDFGIKMSDVIIAVDSRSWRKNSFPYYKVKREIDRKNSEIDHNAMYEFFNEFINDLDSVFPFIVVKTYGAEADDIIGVLSKTLSKKEKVIVISRDKDFKQLISRNVKIFDPYSDKFMDDGEVKGIYFPIITESDANKYRLLHLLIGDDGDSIPNFKCPDNHYLLPGNKRKANGGKPCGEKEIRKEVLNEKSEIDMDRYNSYIAQNKKGWERNKLLIDLNEIPEEIQIAIKKEFIKKLKEPVKLDFIKISKYFVQNSMFDMNFKLNNGTLIVPPKPQKKSLI
jgi:hypothetical protein